MDSENSIANPNPDETMQNEDGTNTDPDYLRALRDALDEAGAQNLPKDDRDLNALHTLTLRGDKIPPCIENLCNLKTLEFLPAWKY